MLMDVEKTNPGKCITMENSLKFKDLKITVNKQVENFSSLKTKLSPFTTVIIYLDVILWSRTITHSQVPPSGMNDLLPQVLKVQPTENPQLSATYQDCLDEEIHFPQQGIFNK